MSNNDDRAAYDPRLKEIKERFPDARRTGPEDAKSALRSYLIPGMIFFDHRNNDIYTLCFNG